MAASGLAFREAGGCGSRGGDIETSPCKSSFVADTAALFFPSRFFSAQSSDCLADLGSVSVGEGVVAGADVGSGTGTVTHGERGNLSVAGDSGGEI